MFVTTDTIVMTVLGLVCDKTEIMNLERSGRYNHKPMIPVRCYSSF